MKKLLIFCLFLTLFDFNSSIEDLEFNDVLKFIRKLNYDSIMIKDTPERFKRRFLSVLNEDLIPSNYFIPKLPFDLSAILHKNTLNYTEKSNSEINLLNYIAAVDQKFIELFHMLTFLENSNICESIIGSTIYNNWFHNYSNDVEYFIRIINYNNNFTKIFENISQDYFNQSAANIGERCYNEVNQTSVQVELFDLYKLISKTERKLIFLVAFMAKYKEICQHKSEYLEFLLYIESNALERFQKYLNQIKPLLNESSQHIFACNPEKNVEGVTYAELKGYKRKIVVKEEDLPGNNNCSYDCSKYQDFFPFSKERYSYCRGKILDCRSGGKMFGCKSSGGDPKLYEWIVDELGNIFGENFWGNVCSASVEFLTTTQKNGNKCDNCICTCTDDVVPSSNQYAVSLRKELASINRVITGIRFKMEDHVLYPQIKTGILLPFGEINSTSEYWKTVNKVNINNPPISLRYEGTGDHIYFGTDVRQADSIALNNVYVNDSFVITGVKFMPVAVDRFKTIAIQLAIRGSSYDFRTGVLGKDHEWVTFDSHFLVKNVSMIDSVTYKRNRVDLTERVDPIVADHESRYCVFKPSSLGKDAGKSTIPFFDLQPVMSNPGVPLKGMGIMQQFIPNFTGGVFKFKITNVDFSHHINNEPGNYHWRDRLGL